MTLRDIVVPQSVLPRGVLILGGSHGTLALARALGAHGVAVVVISNDNPLPRFSRFVRRFIRWPGPSAPNASASLLALCRQHDLEGFALVPAGDGEVRLVAGVHAELSRLFQVMVPPWEQLKWACDKGLAYARAAELGIGVPRIYPPGTPSDRLSFPVVLKPAMRLGRNRFTLDKAWRADDAAQFDALYAEAVALEGIGNVVVQELVTGGGESQLSYAGLWAGGREIAGFTACRRRQYPREFSYTSTYVETVRDDEVADAARRFLTSIGHHGLCEVEFKRDQRDGVLKLLDVNPRPWSWMALAAAAGVDVGVMLWAVARGEVPAPPTAKVGVAWMYLARDAVASAQAMSAGELGLGLYLRSFAAVRSWAAFALNDPLPGLADAPTVLARLAGRFAVTHRPQT